MKQTINRISNRVGDWFATLFALAALLLVPHAIIRPIIGIGLHHWIPIQWLALHVLLIILTFCVALAAYIIADRTAVEPPLPPIDARTEAAAERLFGLRLALRKDSTEIIHEEWLTAPEWIRQGCLRQAIEVLTAADQAEPASADGSDYGERMRVEYRELAARAGRLRDMLQRYADGTLDFELVCPIGLLSRQLDVMDEYAGLLRHRAKIEHVDLEEQDSATE